MRYKVGDKVKVKTWDKMVREFGLDSDVDINCKHLFVKPMDCWCGEEMTIKKVIEYDDRYYMEEDLAAWDWSDDMLDGINNERI